MLGMTIRLSQKAEYIDNAYWVVGRSQSIDDRSVDLRIIKQMKDLAASFQNRPGSAGHSPGEGQHGSTAQVRRLRVEAVHAGQRIDNYLIRELKGVPKTHIYRILRSGEVRVNGARVRPEHRLETGDELRLPPIRMVQPAVMASSDSAPGLKILFEDAHLLAVDKPSGLAVHGGSGISLGVIEQLRAARPAAPLLELAHRLDRETSGVLLVAKTRAALLGLHEIMREKSGDKRYLVAVKGEWVNERQHVKLPLAKYTRHDGERRVEVNREEGQFAHTVFNLRERRKNMSLLEAELCTGRTHQIRVHLQHLGYPIAGDAKYGDVAWNRELSSMQPVPLRRMFLHAYAFRCQHPVTATALEIVSPLPPDLAAFWQATADRLQAGSP
jgi:ribosomal large subunit pseudouridine synthase C (EC 5.4.99.-)